MGVRKMKKVFVFAIVIAVVMLSVYVWACGDDPTEYSSPPFHLSNYLNFPPTDEIRALVKPAFHPYSPLDHTYVQVSSAPGYGYYGYLFYANPSIR